MIVYCKELGAVVAPAINSLSTSCPSGFVPFNLNGGHKSCIRCDDNRMLGAPVPLTKHTNLIVGNLLVLP